MKSNLAKKIFSKQVYIWVYPQISGQFKCRVNSKTFAILFVQISYELCSELKNSRPLTNSKEYRHYLKQKLISVDLLLLNDRSTQWQCILKRVHLSC